MPRSRPISWSLARTSLRVVSPKLRTFKSWSSLRLTRWRTVVIPSLSRQLVARTESSSSARLMSSLRSSSASIGMCCDAVAGKGLGRQARAGLVVLDERVQVLAEDLGGLDQGHLGAEDAGRPDPQNQLVVVGPLADAGVLDVVLDPMDRAEAGVDRDDADFEVVGVSLGGGPIAAAVLDGHFQVERHVVGQGAENVVGIDDLDRFVVQDVGGGDHAPAVAVDPDRARLIRSGS